MTWSESSDNDVVAGYRVYRNGTLLTDVDATSSRSWSTGAWTTSSTYSYRVRGVRRGRATRVP